MTDAQTEARAIVERFPAWPIRWGTELRNRVIEEIATALAVKDEKIQALNDECQQSMLDIARERDRAERAEAQLAEARKALANYDRWLSGRDAYIVQKGLWQNFVASLPGSPAARRALEAQGGE